MVPLIVGIQLGARGTNEEVCRPSERIQANLGHNDSRTDPPESEHILCCSTQMAPANPFPRCVYLKQIGCGCGNVDHGVTLKFGLSVVKGSFTFFA